MSVFVVVWAVAFGFVFNYGAARLNMATLEFWRKQGLLTEQQPMERWNRWLVRQGQRRVF